MVRHPTHRDSTVMVNGNAITLSDLYNAGTSDFKALIAKPQTRFPPWDSTLDLHAQPDAALLASLRGIDPDRDVSLMVIPPPKWLNLKAGNIDGY